MDKKLIREAIVLGFQIACSECHWKISDCPIAKLAEKLDEDFNVYIICEFDEEKVVDKIIERLKEELKENEKV